MHWSILNFILAAVLLAACGGAPGVVVTPTPAPTLDANLWVDYPTVRAGRPQSANLMVADLSGRPVAGATAILDLVCGKYQRRYYFKLTDADGRARVDIDVPPSAADQTVTARVTVIDSSTSHWATVETQFNVIRESK